MLTHSSAKMQHNYVQYTKLIVVTNNHGIYLFAIFVTILKYTPFTYLHLLLSSLHQEAKSRD